MPQPAQNVFHALDQALAQAVAPAGRSVVRVSRGHGNAGSGTVWSDDLVISSSFHSPDRTTVSIAEADGEAEPHTADAEVIGRDPGTDVALLRVAGGGLTAATFREIGELAVGNLALAVGRPGRSVRAQLRAIGVLGPAIRTPHGGKLDRYIESDRQIPRGFAGGPLIDADGAVIGMTTRTLLRGADLAIPTATLRRVVGELAAHGGVRRGYLGVGAFPAKLSPAHAQLVGRARQSQSAGGGDPDGSAGGAGDLPRGIDRGALVASVEDGSPAATAAVIAGDIIVEVAGEPVTGPDSLRLALGDRPGETIELVVLRGGARLVLTVTLGTRP